jgi:excisionase family DNA binding protein
MPSQNTVLPAGQDGSKRGPAEDGPIAFTVAEFARLLGKNPKTVYGWVESRVIPFERIGGSIYIPRYALGCLLAPAEQSPTSPGSEAA